MTKKINTSYKIIKILNLLFEGPKSLAELYYALDSEGWSVKRGTLTKYFTTLRKFGCVIDKRNNTYCLKYFPGFMHLNKDDINILENLAHFSKEILSKDNHNRINEITKMIIEKTFNTNQSKDNYPYKAGLWGKYGKKIETLSYYFGEKINLLHNGEKTCVTPIHFRYGRGKIYLFAFDEKDIENKLYSLDDISEISSARGHSFKINFAKSTIFKLTGRVAKGYTSPYEKEIIEYKEDGSVFVENKFEDKKILMRRLLKYGDMCEIISPKDDRENFKKMVDALIEKYGKM